MGKCKKITSSIFPSDTVAATVTGLDGVVHNNYESKLLDNDIGQPHGGAITAHFTFWSTALEP